MVWFLIAAAALVLGLLVLGRDERGGYLDPRGTNPAGARAVVELVGALGGEVRILPGVPPSDADTALVLDDAAVDEEADALLDWVRDGGRLVIADPSSPRVPPIVGFDAAPFDATEEDWLVLEPGVCDVTALESAGDLLVPEAGAYAVASGDRSCFGAGSSAYVVTRSVGAGTLVSVGSPDPFLNASLGSADNAVLVAALLVPEPGTRFVFIDGFPLSSGIGAGDTSLWGLVGSGVRWGLALLAVAGLVFGLGRARRLGRPVPEPLPVELRGSELVVAVGNVLERGADVTGAATRIRAAAVRRIAGRHGLPADAPVATLAAVLADRHGVDAHEVEAALSADGAGDLRTVVARIDALEQRLGAAAVAPAVPADPPTPPAPPQEDGPV